MYPPLCGEELDVQTCMVTRRSVPIPQTAQVGPEGLGCFRRYVWGGARRSIIPEPLTGRPCLPKLRQERRDSGVSAAMCE